MATTAPSWLPTWLWEDQEPVYQALVTETMGAELYDEDSPDVADHKAIGTMFSWVSQALRWVRERIHPQGDSTALFLEHWEEALGIVPGGSIVERQNRILALFRHRVNGDAASIQRMFASIFGTTPGDVSFASPTIAAIAAVAVEADDFAQLQTTLHIYSASGATPDYAAGRDLIARVKPTFQTWTIGADKTLLWDDSSGATGWDNACWAA